MCVSFCLQESSEGKSLILNRLKQLEEENGEPERRDVLKKRKKQLKDIQSFVQDKSKTSDQKIDFLRQRLMAQVSWNSGKAQVPPDITCGKTMGIKFLMEKFCLLPYAVEGTGQSGS
jgi:uncharacterized protein YcbK (DUF882 family)